MGCASSAVVESTPRHKVESSPAESLPRHQFFTKYSLGEIIGKGSYAQVHVAKQMCSESFMVAVKIQRLRSKSSDSFRKNACRRAFTEICLWSSVGSHRNCVKLLDHFVDRDLCYMVMEKCSYSLISYIKTFTSVTEESLADVFTQMLQGIAHLHSARIAHRDIKPENFLVGGSDAQTVKLCDFGFATFVPAGGKAVGVCGTSPYMCPEMLEHGEAGLKADVWSFGIIAHLFFCGEWPYRGMDDQSMKKAISSGRNISFDKMSWLTLSAKLFLGGLLIRDPRARPNAASSISDPFLTGSQRGQRSLTNMLTAAEALVSFHSPNLHGELSLADLKTRSTTRTLAQNEIDALMRASGKGLDKGIDAVSPPDCSDSDCEKDGISSKSESTNAPSSEGKSSSLDMDMWAATRWGL